MKIILLVLSCLLLLSAAIFGLVGSYRVDVLRRHSPSPGPYFVLEQFGQIAACGGWVFIPTDCGGYATQRGWLISRGEWSGASSTDVA
jgi:hypothetical protein